MRTRRRLVALAGVFIILARFGAPASAEPVPQQVSAAEEPTLDEFAAEVKAALGPFGDLVGAAVDGAMAPAEEVPDGDVQAAHVHPDQSKPEVAQLLVWLKGQLPTLKPMLNKVLHDFDPVSGAMWAAAGPFMDWLGDDLDVAGPILFDIVCIVGDDVIPSWVCDLLLGSLPGLASLFWPIVVTALPTVLGLVGKFFGSILSILIGLVGGSAASASAAGVDASSEVSAAHVHLDLLPIDELLTWLSSSLDEMINLLLPVLYEARTVIAQAVADAAPIFAWLGGQLGAILEPIVNLVCIVADDVPLVPLGCAFIGIFMGVVEGVVQGIIDAVEYWVSRLPFHAGTLPTTTTTATAGSTTTASSGSSTTTTASSTTTTASSTTTTSCKWWDLSCLFGSSAGDAKPIVNSQSGGGGSGGGAALAYALLGLLMVSLSGGLYRLRRKHSLAHAAGW